MKNVIYNYYNILLTDINESNDNYYFYYNSNLYVFYLIENNPERINEIYNFSIENNIDSYKIIGLQFSGLVALVPMDKTKPIYIMPYQEAAYIFKNQKLPDNFSENEQIKEVRKAEKTNEAILKTAYQFEEAKPYMEKANYNENLDFASNYEIMLEQYQKIKIKGEN